MTRIDPAFFHKLYGEKKPRAVYYAKDFLDYALMVLITAIVVAVSYGPRHVLSIVGLGDDALVIGWIAASLINETESFLGWERDRDRTVPGHVIS